jgi:ferredoxin, 2Fe-2S
MITLHVTRPDGRETAVQTPTGGSLMEALRDHDFDEVIALCGGCCSCATCHVYIDDAATGLARPASEDENDLLDSSCHRRDHSRLSCQITLTPAMDGLKLTLAPDD